jgi:ATP-dependent Lon protease
MTIALAGFKDVYAVPDVEEALNELPASANESLRSIYQKMISVGGTRFAMKPSALPDIDGLVQDLPNFGDVLEDVRRQLALCVESPDTLELLPMLLLGEPGIGKTHFARRLAELVGTGYAMIPMSSLTAGWVLSGSSSQWKNAKPGKVFDTLVNGEYANPVIVVDEIDKAGGDRQYDPLGALYTLLERDTARSFVDEFAEVSIDCTEVVWIATANDASCIPDPILNRMNVYEIPPPDDEGVRRIGRSLYREIRADHEWGKQFPEEPGADVLERLADFKPREMRRLLMGAFGSAKLDGRRELVPDDVQGERAKRRQRIGF